MNEHDNREDQMLDRNLRMIGQHIALPDSPAHPQRREWKRAGRFAHADEPSDGVTQLRTQRTFRWITGGALAACLALAALVFVPTRGSTVHAAAIFASFRDAVANGFQLSLKDIGDDGVRVNGRILVALDTDKLAAADGDSVRAAYIELSIRGDEDAAEAAGLDIQLNAGLKKGQEWAYMRLNNLPAEVAEEEPMAAMILQMFQSGVMLELDGLSDNDAVMELLNGIDLGGLSDDESDTEQALTIGSGSVPSSSRSTSSSSRIATFVRWINSSDGAGEETPRNHASSCSIRSSSFRSLSILEGPSIRAISATPDAPGPASSPAGRPSPPRSP